MAEFAKYEGHIVSQSYSPGYVTLSCFVSLVGAASTLELINRRTGFHGWLNKFVIVLLRSNIHNPKKLFPADYKPLTEQSITCERFCDDGRCCYMVDGMGAPLALVFAGWLTPCPIIALHRQSIYVPRRRGG